MWFYNDFAEIVLKTELITEADKCISDWNFLAFHLKKALFFGFSGLFLLWLVFCFGFFSFFFSSKNRNYMASALLNKKYNNSSAYCFGISGKKKYPTSVTFPK